MTLSMVMAMTTSSALSLSHLFLHHGALALAILFASPSVINHNISNPHLH
jgi:hypothetical protein